MEESQSQVDLADAADFSTQGDCEGVIAFDMHGVIISFDAALEALFGYTVEEIIGLPVLVLIAEPTCMKRTAVTSTVLSMEDTGLDGSESCEIVGRRKDGSTFPPELVVKAFYLGDHAGFIGRVREATHRMRREEELLRARQLATVSTLARGIAQGLDTMLTLVMDHISLAKTYVAPSGKVWINLTAAKQACQRVADLAHQLLTLTTKICMRSGSGPA